MTLTLVMTHPVGFNERAIIAISNRGIKTVPI